MISIEGGCNKCGKLMQSKAFNPTTGEIPLLICKECYDKYYSLEALREQKLKRILRRGPIERIKEWLRL
jgi:hypothetical protein